MAGGSGWDQGTHPEGPGGKSMLTMGTGAVEVNIADEGEVKGTGTVGVGSRGVDGGDVKNTAQKRGTHWERTGREEDRSGGMAMGMGTAVIVVTSGLQGRRERTRLNRTSGALTGGKRRSGLAMREGEEGWCRKKSNLVRVGLGTVRTKINK